MGSAASRDAVLSSQPKTDVAKEMDLLGGARAYSSEGLVCGASGANPQTLGAPIMQYRAMLGGTRRAPGIEQRANPTCVAAKAPATASASPASVDAVFA